MNYKEHMNDLGDESRTEPVWCHRCGHKNKVTDESERWSCARCGTVYDSIDQEYEKPRTIIDVFRELDSYFTEGKNERRR